MTQKLALKKLTKSDLTLFKWHFDQQKSNQKAINLNRNVLVDQLYPSLPIIIEEKQGTIPLDLYIYGPGLATEYNLQRKIQKTDSYKNYRLNGEFIADPQDDSDRFHTLKPDDFVIFDFCGDLEPYSARAVFIAQSLTEDAKFHQLLENLINSRSMITLQTQELKSLIEQANLLNQHPAKLLTTESNLEDAALGGIEGITALRSGPYHGKVSRKDLENAKKDAHKTGRLGEEWVLNYLEMKKQKNLILDFNWIANDNAISPYDFSIVALDESIILIDVKSTKGDFNNRIHISYNELLQMREAQRYDLYRVFDIEDDSAQLRIAQDIKSFAISIIEILQNLPSGVKSDGISVSPLILNFGEPEKIIYQEEEL